MRSVAYIRASDKANPLRVETMLDEQRESIRQWAESQDFELVAIFEDRNSSASDLRRPAFRALLQLAHEPEPGFAAILLYGGNRWCRDIYRSLEIERDLRDVGVTLLIMPSEYGGRWPAPVPDVEIEPESKEPAGAASNTMKAFYDDLLRLSRLAEAVAKMPRRAILKRLHDLGLSPGDWICQVLQLMDQLDLDFERIGQRLGHAKRQPSRYRS